MSLAHAPPGRCLAHLLVARLHRQLHPRWSRVQPAGHRGRTFPILVSPKAPAPLDLHGAGIWEMAELLTRSATYRETVSSSHSKRMSSREPRGRPAPSRRAGAGARDVPRRAGQAARPSRTPGAAGSGPALGLTCTVVPLVPGAACRDPRGCLEPRTAPNPKYTACSSSARRPFPLTVAPPSCPAAPRGRQHLALELWGQHEAEHGLNTAL